jgi:hypothetical protein
LGRTEALAKRLGVVLAQWERDGRRLRGVFILFYGALNEPRYLRGRVRDLLAAVEAREKRGG